MDMHSISKVVDSTLYPATCLFLRWFWVTRFPDSESERQP